jgi:hypothetical protein
MEEVKVAGDLVATELCRRVRVNREEAQSLFITSRLTPDLRPRQQEPLGSGEPVDNRRFFSVQRQLVGLPRNGQPPEVTDVFANGQFPVDVVTGQGGRFERVHVRGYCTEPAAELAGGARLLLPTFERVAAEPGHRGG